MSEIIVKGCIVGLFLFTIARWIYWKGWLAGANFAKDYIFNELKKK